MASQFTDETIIWIDGHTHAEVHYKPNPELVVYLESLRKGHAVRPAVVTLELGPE